MASCPAGAQSLERAQYQLRAASGWFESSVLSPDPSVAFPAARCLTCFPTSQPEDDQIARPESSIGREGNATEPTQPTHGSAHDRPPSTCRSLRRQTRADARGVPRPPLPPRRLARRHRHLQAHHVGRRPGHRPRPRRLSPDHAQGAARAGGRQPAHHGRARGDARPVVPPAAAARRHRAGRSAGTASTRPREPIPHETVASTCSTHQPGDDIHLPVDVWGFPGGQTFLPGVPCLSFEGPGGVISYLEPAMCRYFAPVIQATKARLMKLATPRDAEFGLRSAPQRIDQPRPAAGPLRRRSRPAHLQRHGRVPLPGAVPARSAPSATR